MGDVRGVDSGGTVVRRHLALERTPTLDTLHFLATPVADGAGTFGAWTPLPHTLAVLVAARLAALTTDVLADSVLCGVPSSSNRRGAWYLTCGGR